VRSSRGTVRIQLSGGNLVLNRLNCKNNRASMQRILSQGMSRDLAVAGQSEAAYCGTDSRASRLGELLPDGQRRPGIQIRKKRSIQRNPRWHFMQRWPSPKATKKLRERVREITSQQQSGKDIYFYDYRTNVPLYPEFQKFFRKNRPPTLIVWGKNDFIFPPEGAAPYSRDLKNLETHLLDTGHFALETHGEEIASLIETFLNKNEITR